MSVLVNYIVTCGSNSRRMNFQRHKADDPAKLECEVIVTPVCECVCVCLFVHVVLVCVSIPLLTKQIIFIKSLSGYFEKIFMICYVQTCVQQAYKMSGIYI